MTTIMTMSPFGRGMSLRNLGLARSQPPEEPLIVQAAIDEPIFPNDLRAFCSGVLVKSGFRVYKPDFDSEVGLLDF